MRIHISLNVTDLDASVRFYETLFGVAPSKRRPGYAKFEPPAPALNLALNEVAARADHETRVSHFGVQVSSQQAVRDAAERLGRAELPTQTQEGVTCCYAVQDKVWVADPDGNPWEIFVVTQADTAAHSDGRSRPAIGCC